MKDFILTLSHELKVVNFFLQDICVELNFPTAKVLSHFAQLTTLFFLVSPAPWLCSRALFLVQDLLCDGISSYYFSSSSPFCLNYEDKAMRENSMVVESCELSFLTHKFPSWGRSSRPWIIQAPYPFIKPTCALSINHFNSANMSRLNSLLCTIWCAGLLFKFNARNGL